MKSKIIQKSCNIILDILIVIIGIILLGTIYNTIQVKVLNKKKADFFGYTTFEVQTGSMAPTINASDLIIVKKDNKVEIKDIITYEKNGEYITHRIVDLYKDTLVTKGDANNTKDEAIKKEQIVGKVVKVIPGFGLIRKTILNPVVLITLVITVYIIGLIFKKNDEKTKLDLILENLYKKAKNYYDDIIEKINNKKTESSEQELVVKKIINSSVDDTKEAQQEQLADIIKEEKEEKLNVVESLGETRAISLDEIQEALNEDTDLDKTMCFRKILVDPIEYERIIEDENINNAALEVEEEVNEDSEEYQVKLEYLSKRKKKINNLAEKFLFLKREELFEILNIITNKKRLKVNEAQIKDNLFRVYVDARYYNKCGNINVDYNKRNIFSRINDELMNSSSNMIRKYKGSDNKYSIKVSKYCNLFILLLYLEEYYLSKDDTQSKIEAYKNKIEKYISNEYKNDIIIKIKDIIKTQKIYSKILKNSLEKMNTNTFELKYNQLSFDKDIYALNLNHNINFSKVYSNYIIDKTYNEGIIAEDKMLITINLVTTKIIENMINKEFDDKYLLYMPSTIFQKENKISRITKLLDDEMIKNDIVLLIKYGDAIRNKNVVKNICKLGFKISLIFDKNYDIKNKDISIIGLANYLFVDKKTYSSLNSNSILGKKYKSKIITENILPKVGIEEGE